VPSILTGCRIGLSFPACGVSGEMITSTEVSAISGDGARISGSGHVRAADHDSLLGLILNGLLQACGLLAARFPKS
jgi:hypothetical protein